VLLYSLNAVIPTLTVLLYNLILFLNGRVVVQADGRRPGLKLRPFYVRYAVDKAALGHASVCSS